MKLPDIRCIHRHTITEHPACFAQGLVKYNIQDEKEWQQITGQPWYTWPEYRIGYLDIESDNLNADWGTMLSWCIKDKGGEVHYDVVTKKDLFSGVYDRRIVKSIVDALYQYKIIVSYYGTGFDLPYIRAKALHYGFDFPGYGELFHWDIYYTVKSKLKISRKSLANATAYLGIEGKTPISYGMWNKAKYGDEEGLAEVLSHNVADVEILEKLHDKLSPFRKWIKTSV